MLIKKCTRIFTVSGIGKRFSTLCMKSRNKCNSIILQRCCGSYIRENRNESYHHKGLETYILMKVYYFYLSVYAV